jgi:hypothetical protein
MRDGSGAVRSSRGGPLLARLSRDEPTIPVLRKERIRRMAYIFGQRLIASDGRRFDGEGFLSEAERYSAECVETEFPEGRAAEVAT